MYEEPIDPIASMPPAEEDDDEDHPGGVYNNNPSNKPSYNAPPDAIYTVCLFGCRGDIFGGE